jgi:CheY-like chemotaxis protein
LLDHVSNEVAADDFGRTVTLIVGHTADRCIFSVVEATEGAGVDISSLDLKPEAKGQGLPAIFQRYHQELLPEDMVDLEAAGDLRDKIETGINSNRTNSVGLGLSLSYHLVLTLGGDLRYSSLPEMTKFWFSLPHNNGEQKSERILFERPKQKARPGLFVKAEEKNNFPYTKANVAREGLKAMESPSILVVEDVPMCAKLLCTILRQFNCSTKWVQNGQEAVDLLRKEPGMYNLIFMDLRMPVMDGLTATKIIKDELKMKTPVVALTGEGGSKIQEECKCIGFDAYCNKPMKRDYLMNVIKEHTGYVHSSQ